MQNTYPVSRGSQLVSTDRRSSAVPYAYRRQAIRSILSDLARVHPVRLEGGRDDECEDNIFELRSNEVVGETSVAKNATLDVRTQDARRHLCIAHGVSPGGEGEAVSQESLENGEWAVGGRRVWKAQEKRRGKMNEEEACRAWNGRDSWDGRHGGDSATSMAAAWD